jgi:hypothetical protein
MSAEQRPLERWLGVILVLNGLYFTVYGPSGMGYFLMLLGIIIVSGQIGKNLTGRQRR